MKTMLQTFRFRNYCGGRRLVNPIQRMENFLKILKNRAKETEDRHSAA